MGGLFDVEEVVNLKTKDHGISRNNSGYLKERDTR